MNVHVYCLGVATSKGILLNLHVATPLRSQSAVTLLESQGGGQKQKDFLWDYFCGFYSCEARDSASVI